MEEAKKRFSGKQLHSHTEAFSAAWVEQKEQEILARRLADTWNTAMGPVADSFPIKGFSPYNSKAGPKKGYTFKYPTLPYQ